MKKQNKREVKAITVTRIKNNFKKQPNKLRS